MTPWPWPWPGALRRRPDLSLKLRRNAVNPDGSWSKPKYVIGNGIPTKTRAKSFGCALAANHHSSGAAPHAESQVRVNTIWTRLGTHDSLGQLAARGLGTARRPDRLDPDVWMVRIRSTPKHRESSTALTVLRSCILAFALTVVADLDHQIGEVYPLTSGPLMCGTVAVAVAGKLPAEAAVVQNFFDSSSHACSRRSTTS